MFSRDELIVKANEFYSKETSEPNGRYHSWEICYSVFYNARQNKDRDYDNLSLHLGFYLASWGMMRSSSFLLEKDYTVHMEVVKEILKEEYDCLLGIEFKDYNADMLVKLIALRDKIKSHYDEVREKIRVGLKTSKVTDTLITKVLMGTLGCVPSYDKYLCIALKDGLGTQKTFNRKSMEDLISFYENNCNLFEVERSKMKINDMIVYPQMKFLDMGLWGIGKELDN